MTPTKSPISKEFIVACEIYHNNTQKKKVTFDSLSKVIKDPELKEHIKLLLSFGVIDANYDTELNKRTLKISLISEENIKEMYDLYYKNIK